MQRRYLLIAAAGVTAVLILLTWRPAEEVQGPGEPRPADRIVELPAVSEDVPVATVEPPPPPPIIDQPGGAGADASLIARFETEQTDPQWADDAARRLQDELEPVLVRRDARVDRIDCRRTACRLDIVFEIPAQRPQHVAALVDFLDRAGHVALIERVDRDRVVLLVAPAD